MTRHEDQTPLERLNDAVDELTLPRTHREPLNPDQAPKDARTLRDLHGAVVNRVPSLLTQLEKAVEPSGGVQAGHRVPGSQPPARIEAMDVLLEIDTESSLVLAWLGGTARGTLAGSLRALVGLCAPLQGDDPNLHQIARYAASWRVKAALVTGWEVPARSPDNTCPLCAARGTLRVRVDISTGSGTAFCVGCREAWDETTIGLLAQHIRVENDDERLEDTA